MATKGTDSCFQHAEEDEELFTLLARDPLAPLLVRLWAALGGVTGQEPAKRAEARRCAALMEAWRQERRPLKAPADPDLERRLLEVLREAGIT